MWLSIDSAPRDHSIIRGQDIDGDVFLCRWWTKEQVAEYEDDDPENWDSGWLDVNDPDVGYDPIYWQPISGAN